MQLGRFPIAAAEHDILEGTRIEHYVLCSRESDDTVVMANDVGESVRAQEVISQTGTHVHTNCERAVGTTVFGDIISRVNCTETKFN